MIKLERALNGYIVRCNDVEEREMVFVYENFEDVVWKAVEVLEAYEDWADFRKQLVQTYKTYNSD